MFLAGLMPEPLRQSSTTVPRSCNPRSKRCRNRLMIAERQGAITDDLSGLMSFAGDQERIARLQRGNRGADRFGAVGDLFGAFRSAQDGGANRFRIFAARIVICDDNVVGIFG